VAKADKRARRADKPAGPGLLQLSLPFLVFGAAVLAAAFHKALGSPLGEGANAELNRVWQTFAVMLVVYGPMMGYVQRQNALAQTHEERRRLPADSRPSPGEETDDEHPPRQRRVPGPRDPR
jgi:hypothetical protein